MEEKKNYKVALENIEKELRKMDKNLFKCMFFVEDTKGVPSGSLAYIYETALKISKLGYKVEMLYAEKDFVGVGDWLGEDYANLPHFNTEKDKIDASPSDILFIPELYSNVMAQTKGLVCKRVVILQNFDKMVELIPAGASWEDLKIRDCVTTTDALAERIKDIFPYVRTRVVRPSIPDYFKKTNEPKKLIVNIVAKDNTDMNLIVKPFMWKYPLYNWVAFRNIRTVSKQDAANAFKEAAITVWCDPYTDFGYAPIEAMKAGSIVVGKIPENEPEWLKSAEGKGIRDNGVWFYNIKDVPEILGGIIQSFLTDNIPASIYDEMEKTAEPYTDELQLNDIKREYVDGIFEDRKKELVTLKEIIKNKEEKNEE